MYPNLSYLVHALTGWGPDNFLSVIQTFGLFLAIAFLVSAWFLSRELKRKGDEGLFQPVKETTIVGGPPSWTDVIWNAVFGFAIGFKGIYAWQNAAAFQDDAASVILSAQGSMIGGLIGMLLFGGWKYWLRIQNNGKGEQKTVVIWPHERVWDIAMIAGISGVGGSKLFSILEDPAALAADPMGQIFSGSGLNIFGGLIMGFIGVYSYIRWKKIPGLHLIDSAAPALIVGYAVGRVGCQLSGDGDWGIPNPHPIPDWWFLPDWIWAFDFPHNVIHQGVPIDGCTWKFCEHLPEMVYPTAFYETILGLIILGILWILRKRIHFAGVLFFVYVLLIAIERFFIEKIRVNQKFDVLGWQATQAEVIAVILFFVGIAGILIFWQRGKKQANLTQL